MTSLVLTLVARREETSLAAQTIALARDIVLAQGETVVLSPAEAVDIPCPQTARESLPALHAAMEGQAIDVLLTPAANRRKRLLVSDMDSTIVANETLDDLATHAGLGEKVAAITARSMNGELDFATSLRERVALLRGLPTSLLETAWKDVTLNPGALEMVRTMSAFGARTALVSGGFTFFTARVAALCGFDEHHANVLLMDKATDSLTGETAQPVLGQMPSCTCLKPCNRATTCPKMQRWPLGMAQTTCPCCTGLALGWHSMRNLLCGRPLPTRSTTLRCVQHCSRRVIRHRFL